MQYSQQTWEIHKVKPLLCRCGLSFFKGRAEGVQRFEGQRSSEQRTCLHCGQTQSFELDMISYVRQARCQEILIEVASRDDIPGHERARRIHHILAEMTEAQRETMRGRS